MLSANEVEGKLLNHLYLENLNDVSNGSSKIFSMYHISPDSKTVRSAHY